MKPSILYVPRGSDPLDFIKNLGTERHKSSLLYLHYEIGVAIVGNLFLESVNNNCTWVNSYKWSPDNGDAYLNTKYNETVWHQVIIMHFKGIEINPVKDPKEVIYVQFKKK